MTTWIITYNVDNNTHVLKVESERKPALEDAVDLVTQKAEQEYEELEYEVDPGEEQTPAVLLSERFGITITGISEH